MKNFTTVLILSTISFTLVAETITNDDVIRMAKAGLSAETIELKIEYSDPSFDTSTDALIALREAGVTDATIRAIIEKQKGAPPKVAGEKAQEASPAPASSATDSTDGRSSVPAATPEPIPAGASPPAAPTSAPSVAPTTRPSRSTFEVTVRNAVTGATCSSGFLEIDGKGLGVTGCLGSNFRIKWTQLESACSETGETPEVRLTTAAGTRVLSAESATERDLIVARMRERFPSLAINSCGK